MSNRYRTDPATSLEFKLAVNLRNDPVLNSSQRKVMNDIAGALVRKLESDLRALLTPLGESFARDNAAKGKR